MGRVPTKIEGNGSPISHLWEVHKEIARLQVSGLRPVEISRRLNYTQSWLSTIMCSPVYIAYLAKLSARKDDAALDIASQIKEGAVVGVSELLKILKGTKPSAPGEQDCSGAPLSLRVKIAQDFLDREGHAKITKVKNETSVTVLNGERIENLKARRSELLRNLVPVQQIEDATVVSSSS